MKYVFMIFALILSLFSFEQKEEDYYSSGIKKSDLKDHQGAIADYSKAIEFDPEHYLAYYNRAVEKTKIGNLKGAILDYTKVIEINPIFEAFYGRGRNKAVIEDYEGAIQDFNKAIEMDPKNSGVYFDRGLSKLIIGEKESGRRDLKQARMMIQIEVLQAGIKNKKK